MHIVLTLALWPRCGYSIEVAAGNYREDREMTTTNRIAKIGSNDEHVAAWREEGVAKPAQRGIRIERVDGRLDGFLPLPLASAQYNDIRAIDPRDFAALADVLARDAAALVDGFAVRTVEVAP
jgi:hypothetical protein